MTNQTLWPAERTTEGRVLDMPPRDHPYLAACWLAARHPMVDRLLRRVANMVVEDVTGEWEMDLNQLGEIFAAVPLYDAAWKAYERSHREPSDEQYDAWVEAGPHADDFADGMSNILVMSGGEQARLRLLATLSAVRVPFCVDDLRSLDGEGQDFLNDWCAAVKVS